jgi:hypothetical protein
MTRASFILTTLIAIAASACTTELPADRDANTDRPLAPRVLHGSVESRLRMLPREFVASTLESVYGPSAAPAVNGLIRARADQFGGPCDTNLGDCAQNSQSQLSLIPIGVSGRYGYLTRACDVISMSDNAILFAVREALGLPALPLASVPSPDAGAIQAAFDLFYQDRTPDAGVLGELAALVAQSVASGHSPLDQWRFLLLALCLSPGWQIL